MTDPAQAPHPRALCGRGDLVRALLHGDDRVLAAVAARLGFEPCVTPDSRGSDAGPAVIVTPPPETGGVGDPPPALTPSPLLPVHFWQATERTDQPETAPAALPDGPTALPDWSERPPELARARPLAQWHDLLPRLRRALAEPTETHTLDVPAIVRRLGRGESLPRLPRRCRPHWGLSLHLIEDRSDHLAPYWDDQEAVRNRLFQLFPRYSVEHALWFEGLREPVWATQARVPYRLPPPGSLVVVLGDLGGLLRGGGGQRRYWRDLGRRLRADGCRLLALTPGPGCTAAALHPWRLLRWEHLPPTPDGPARTAVVQRLLALAGNTLRLEPGLLRGLRLLIGADAGAESEVWQDGSVIGRSAVAATLSPNTAEQRRAAFLAEPAPIRAAAFALQRAWRAGLPPEIWLAELQALAPAECARLVSQSDSNDSCAFIAALGRQAAGVGGAAPVPGAMAWFRDITPWLRADYLADPALGPYFYALWAEILRRDPRQTLPPELDPERLPSAQPARRVTLAQRGRTLRAAYEPEGEADPGFLAQMQSANGVIRLEVPLETPAAGDERAAFWEDGLPPPWADDWGWDDHGAWVDFAVTAQDGAPVVQRMRWILPGTFQMGSPQDEPGRWDYEGPLHPVTIAQGYWLFDTPCTQALWQAVTGDNPSRFKDPQRPVEQVSWEAVQRFLAVLNACVPGLGLSLPSEAQWEHACRAGTQTALYSGPIAIRGDMDAPALDRIAWYGGNSGVDYDLAEGEDSTTGWFAGRQKQYDHQRAGTRKVKGKDPNAWGLYDMLGNVLEWVEDHWHQDYRDAPADGSAWLLESSGAGRVIRGGSWDDDARLCRCAFRYGGAPDGRLVNLGFRCARVQVREQDQQGAGRSAAGGPGAARPAVADKAGRRQLRARSGTAAGGFGLVVPAVRSDPGGEDGAERQATDGVPMAMRLDDAGQAALPLPDLPALAVRTDRECLTLRRTPRPAWASAMGRDRYGLWAEFTIAPERGPAVVQRLRWCPPGRFTLGSPPDEPGRWEAEGPRHQVSIGTGFWLFDSPCTQALWTAVGLENPSRFRDPERPVEQVSWKDVHERFLPALNQRVPGFVLPSEAQWEYACRAGTETALYTGPIEILGDLDAPALHPIAWYGGNSGVDYDLSEAEDSTTDWWKDKRKQFAHDRAGARKVKHKAPNPWGLYDMLGNVWEWVEDEWRDDYDGAPADGSVWQTGRAGAGRVIRGGSWYAHARYCRCAGRRRNGPANRDGALGFRCARVQS